MCTCARLSHDIYYAADVYGKSRHEYSKRNSKGQCKLQKQQAKKIATKTKEDEEFKNLKLKYE